MDAARDAARCWSPSHPPPPPSSVDALREMDGRDGWSTSNDDDVRSSNPGGRNIPRSSAAEQGAYQRASRPTPSRGGDDDDDRETDPSSPSRG